MAKKLKLLRHVKEECDVRAVEVALVVRIQEAVDLLKVDLAQFRRNEVFSA